MLFETGFFVSDAGIISCVENTQWEIIICRPKLIPFMGNRMLFHVPIRILNQYFNCSENLIPFFDSRFGVQFRPVIEDD